ncbi:MAG TPA: MarR family transcriptional regulator [Gemmatimonadales bacterium]|jgi:DNA-binding transcriptional regulator GbsR (MarR family)|nr:MarR family transcriptional regulator [Gemmatimonadales bacterium]
MDVQTAHFIERMGLALEADGLPRIAGRIFGLLLVSEDARSLDDLARQLRVSKASVSTNARMLEQRAVLERISRPGDRRDYYRVPTNLFSHTMAQRVARWQRFHEAIGDARTSLPIRSAEVLERLEEYQEAYAYMSQVITEALAQWQATRGDRLAKVGALG